MIIKRDSWHFRLLWWLNDGEKKKMPKTLCGYFWMVFLAVWFNLVMGSVVFAFAAGAITITAVVLFGPIFGFGPEGLFLVSVWVWMVLAIIAIDYVRKRKRTARPDSLLYRKVLQAPKLPTENILFRYLLAKKQKVCPVLEYEEYK